MNYWAIINNVKVGPLSIEQLMACGVTAETQVWCDGMTQWVAAATVPELASIFAAKSAWNSYSDTPNPNSSTILPPCPTTYLVWAILSTLFCCWPIGIVAIVYASQVSTKYSKGDYDGAKRSSEQAALWTIITFVAGLVLTPFLLIFP